MDKVRIAPAVGNGIRRLDVEEIKVILHQIIHGETIHQPHQALNQLLDGGLVLNQQPEVFLLLLCLGDVPQEHDGVAVFSVLCAGHHHIAHPMILAVEHDVAFQGYFRVTLLQRGGNVIPVIKCRHGSLVRVTDEMLQKCLDQFVPGVALLKNLQ